MLLRQRWIEFSLQRGQIAEAFHLAEFSFRFQESGGCPTQGLIAGVPALHIAGDTLDGGKTRLDGIGGGQAAAQ